MAKTQKKQPVKKFIHMNGKKGKCLICATEQSDVVNGVCFSCLTGEKARGKRN